MIIILSIAAILIVFSTNVLPDLIDEKPTTHQMNIIMKQLFQWVALQDKM